eukprot:TRINITY_DN20158_c0_g1_i1.p1 TRINITY_DN20158_c0_g1~~TRINITY_DN20158_c0_g1_i1.p1  ORF type:complete len:310 (+),score=61.12 TRINITY_DN20158_c0_g1_i1:31-930(+)
MNTIALPQPMPTLGLGTWKADKGVVGNAVKEAISIGYRMIDCAAIYQNEAEVGEALAECFAAGTVKREDIFITSKLWNNMHRSADVRAGLEQTLRDLRLTSVDLYLIHWPVAVDHNGTFINVPIQETWKEMEKLVDAGLAKNIGVSNFNQKQLTELLAICRIKPVMNQIEAHPFLVQRKLRQFCQEHNIHLTAYSPLGSNDSGMRGKAPNLLQDPIVSEIAKQLGKSPAQILIRWSLQMGYVCIPKATSRAHLADNFNVNFTIPPEAMKKMESLDCGLRTCNGSIFFNGRTEAEFWGEK